MTTPARAALYLEHHNNLMAGRRIVIFNPHDHLVTDLPVIYGFNNGPAADRVPYAGNPILSGCILAEDGTRFSGHLSTDEGYMPHDLGVLENTRPDRHVEFRQHYPDGYRMEFVGYDAVEGHEKLQQAFKLYLAKQEAHGMVELVPCKLKNTTA